MVDAQGRPYFLWDVDMTLDELTRQLAEADVAVRAQRGPQCFSFSRIWRGST
jgi:hypothetical protein